MTRPDNRTVAACAGWALVMLAFVPWYLEPDGVRLGIQSGLLALGGLGLGIAAWVLVLYPRDALKDKLVLDLAPEQVAFLCAAASTALLAARLLFKPTFGTSAVSVETKASVFLALANAGLLLFVCLKQTQEAGVGMPFSGALAARSLPDGHAPAQAPAQAPNPGWASAAQIPPQPPQAPPSAPAAPAEMGPDEGWYPDPSGLYVARYFDGRTWTGRVRDSNGELIDPNFSGG